MKQNKALRKRDSKTGLNFAGIKFCGPLHPQNFWEDLILLINLFKNIFRWKFISFLRNLIPVNFDPIKVIKRCQLKKTLRMRGVKVNIENKEI